MRKVWFLLPLLFIFFLFRPANAFAEKINSFDVKIVAHKDGLMDINETIDYDFESLSRHGIFRYIPLYSKVGDLYRITKIDNVNIERDGESEEFKTTQNNQNINFKIGDPDRTITGAHVYKISYTVENGIGSNFPDFDEIYWNATGNDWPVAIEKASIDVATDFGINPTNFICYTGTAGSKDANCTINGSSAGTGLLSAGEGLTAVAVYPANTFPKSILSKSAPSTFAEKIFGFIWQNILGIYFLLNIILPAILIFWYQKKKNKKRFGPPTVNFDTPEDEKGNRLPPALAGTIDNAKLDRNDVTATIFDLAIRKYIKLEEKNTESKVLGVIKITDKKQTITKLKEDDGKLTPFEKKLYSRLFESGNNVDVEDLKADFYKTYRDMETEIFKQLVEKKYYTKNPQVQRGFLVFFGIVSFFTLNIILGAVLFFLFSKLIGRTPLGDEIDHKIDGLKLFLKSMDRNYNWQAMKFYTVEQMIPYAMALGYIDKFMEQLKIIKPDYNPTWYSGYRGSFYASYLGFYYGMNSNITTSAPSSSSGASGGFSGGGGGGGGGGSW
ncbi:MAG: DUF2207 domain-containing protein [Patescibacteria group bacterium]